MKHLAGQPSGVGVLLARMVGRQQEAGLPEQAQFGEQVGLTVTANLHDAKALLV
jgi:hypothetical protein